MGAAPLLPTRALMTPVSSSGSIIKRTKTALFTKGFRREGSLGVREGLSRLGFHSQLFIERRPLVVPLGVRPGEFVFKSVPAWVQAIWAEVNPQALDGTKIENKKDWDTAQRLPRSCLLLPHTRSRTAGLFPALPRREGQGGQSQASDVENLITTECLSREL